MTAKTRKMTAALFFAIAGILWCIAGTFVFAAAEETTGSLTLWCAKDEDIVSGMHWQLYRVGHREANDYVFEGAFEGYRATLGDRTKPMTQWDSETAEAAGLTLKIKTIVDRIPCRAEGTTDDAGAVTFSGLENGLYLVWGNILTVGETTYIPGAVFFEMRGEDASVLNAYPKIVLRIMDTSDVRYSVRKVWADDAEQQQNRSVSVTVARYRDNVYFDEIELNEANDWTFSWQSTNDHIWFVHEKVIPEHYSVSYRENDTQFLIVNTLTDKTTETTTTVTSATTGTATTSAAVTTDKVPQTGQLWWPVPVLAGGGLVFIGMGAAMRKKDDEE